MKSSIYMETFLKFLEKAEKTLKVMDHIVYVTFPLIKEKRLLLKILLEINEAVSNCITSILQYEYLYKRIRLDKDSRENFKIFREKCAPRYKITEEEIVLISDLFNLAQKHKESGFEFVKNEKIVILSENLKTEIITHEKIKIFLSMAKRILEKTKSNFLSRV